MYNRMTRLAKKNQIINIIVGGFRSTTVSVNVVYKNIFTFLANKAYLTLIIVSFENIMFVSSKSNFIDLILNYLCAVFSVIRSFISTKLIKTLRIGSNFKITFFSRVPYFFTSFHGNILLNNT